MAPNSRWRAPIGLLLAALAAQLLLVPSTSSPAVAAGGSLTVSPRVYVGGQLLTFEGNLGRANQRIHLESLAVNRPGAKWMNVPRSGNRTDGRGRFNFQHPAPSMFNKKYRVAGGGRATDGVVLRARSQDLVVYTEERPEAGEPFQLVVDTVPGPHRRPKDMPYFLSHRQDLPAPVFPGRELTLQQRQGNGWRTLDSTETNRDGQGFFRVVEDNPGDIVYRVRQENYPQAGGPPIGWFPSFPTPIRVHGSSGAAAAAPTADRASAPPARRADRSTAPLARGAAPNTTAAQRHRWGPSLWDFAWETGEALTSPPARGRDRNGWWLDTSDGLGRAARHNGGLNLESSRNHAGRGDIGTTAITMQNNAMRYGRWEVRVRVGSVERNARDYLSRVELVPSSGEYCAKQAITVAQLQAHSPRMRFGATSAKRHRQWNRTRRVGGINDQPLALAVEVARKRVSWFLNGRLIGVAPRAAVPRVPLTMRLSLVGKRRQEMNSTEAKYDWMRGYTLERGKKAGRRPKLRARRLRGSC